MEGFELLRSCTAASCKKTTKHSKKKTTTFDVEAYFGSRHVEAITANKEPIQLSSNRDNKDSESMLGRKQCKLYISLTQSSFCEAIL